MKLQAKQSNKTVVPSGTFAATCVGVFDLGTQEYTWSGQVTYRRQILLMFKMISDGEEFYISRRYTASLHEKSKLRQDLIAWRGRDFTDLETLEFDTSSLLGKSCLITIVHQNTGNIVRSKIAGITKLPKGMVPPSADVMWSYEIERDGLDFPVDAPKWIHETVMNSQEYKNNQIKPALKMKARRPIIASEQDKLPQDAKSAPVRKQDTQPDEWENATEELTQDEIDEALRNDSSNEEEAPF